MSASAGQTSPPAGDAPIDVRAVVAETRAWLERAVVGLNLCPFAKAPLMKEQIRYAVAGAQDPLALLEALCTELQALARAEPAQVETTLLIHPRALTDFVEYNDFLDLADAALAESGLAGVLQIASFHPRYCFAGTAADDVSNATNQSPYPMLHLLREASVTRAVEAFPEVETIYETNIRTLRALGAAGWAELRARCHADAVAAGAGPTPS
jgi:hypothetical protein